MMEIDLQDQRRRELLRKFQSGDKQAGEIFAQENFPIVIEAVNKYHKNVEVFNSEEKVAIGNIGFAHAMRNYDPDGEQKFSTYAYKCINGRVLTALRDYREVSVTRREQEILRAIKKGELSKAEILKKFDVSDYEYGLLERTSVYTVSLDGDIRGVWTQKEDGKAMSYVEQLEDDRDVFKKSTSDIEFFNMIEELTEREKMVITAMLYHGYTQTELSKYLGRSQATVSRIYYRALGKLKDIYMDAERGKAVE